MIIMWWNFENSTDEECFDHLGENVPDSIKEAAKQELEPRGYDNKTIQKEEWKRMD